MSSLFDQPGSPSSTVGSPPSGVVNGPSGVVPPNITPGSPRPPFVGSTVPGSPGSPGAPSIPPQFSSVGGVETVSAGIGVTGSFYNTQGGGSPGDQYGAFVNSDFTAIVPRRSRWFNNILKSREKSGLNNTNPNGNNIP